MDAPDQVVDSGGGAVFQGDVTAGRDITINHITEIRQVTERLSSRSTSADISEKTLGSLEALCGAAEFTEEYAKELKVGVFASDLPLERITRECASILTELKRLESLLGRDGDGGDVFTASLNEDVVDIRSRLMSLQMHLSNMNSRKTAKDFETIKEAVTRLMNSQSSSDEASSIRTFYTASAIPYVERQMWQEVQNALCARFTTDFVRDNYALIVASVEELVFENTSSWIAHGPQSDDLPSKAPKARAAGTDLCLSEKFNVATSHIKGADVAVQDQSLSVEDGADDDASISPIYNNGIDPTGVRWSELVEGGSGECLLTLDGGGVKSYSSILIIEALMEEIVACENLFELEFTHYPRTFSASYFRPCHYFHKVYGTSTGGILAIALSRLRMSVTQTIKAFESVLTAMYGSPAKLNPLATKYNHSGLEATLHWMVQQYCKQHDQESCNHEENFRWPLAGIPIEGDDEGLVDPYESDGSGGPDPRLDDFIRRQQERRRSERRGLEYHVCQTICLTTVHNGQIDEARLLRTYNHVYDYDIAPPWVTYYNQYSPDLTIPQVGRATTAAPLFFKVLEVNDPRGNVAFKDGGIRENNPSYCAYSEACSLRGDELEPSLLLSIGAGLTSFDSDEALSEITPFGLPALTKWAKKRAVFKDILIKYAEGQDRHRMMRTIAKGGHTWYKRFDVTHGLETIRIDQGEGRSLWKTLNTAYAATQAYLNRRERDVGASEYDTPGRMLQQTAEKLVRMRRARELEAMTEGGKKREQWEAFMGKHLPGEREFYRKYQEEWDFALLGRKQ
ncbi:hypothetical protein GT037_009609 [Alternaria burnsii]|uniref:PNPLA domain-containing protein n=1 Tax=Alternaria burnsii TaxID=1187904 RepID=A0A8H7B4B2_9PLEO|nr:uncharacterized protein GT037_009609 [Alternaria burnsii]KAF7672578.1 hypothetical protein GT037_009609 [Alternaria burnsii]